MAPVGNRLDEGFSTIYTLPNVPTIALWELEVTPPGVDGGDPIPTDSMRSTKYRTKRAKMLVDFTPSTLRVAYDEKVYTDIINQVNINQLMVITFPTGRPLTFWGYLKSFMPDGLSEGARPTAMVTIIPTNQNAAGAEIAPVIGTTTSSTTTTTTTTT